MTINLITPVQSLHHSQVEWDTLKNIITQFALFESNKTDLCSRVYKIEGNELLQEFNRIESYKKEATDDFHRIFYKALLPLSYDDALENHLNHLLKEGLLSFSEINQVALLIEAALSLSHDLPKSNLREPIQINEVDYQPIIKRFLKEFRYLVDHSGQIHFDKHPELMELHKRLGELEERIRRTVNDWLKSPANAPTLQYQSYDIHYDRFVVPIRSDSYQAHIGFIISRSESGQTLFVEPFVIRDLCNKRIELKAKIDEVINQLALRFSRALSEFASDLRDILVHIKKIDFYLAKVRFCEDYHLCRPFIKKEPGFRLTNLFHPLIRNPIRNDVLCSSEKLGIVISGPNTGGKTVFLKSITLSYMLFYHGFFVPAQEAELYPYEGIFYFGNDLQSLAKGLSSFSGEVKNYLELIEKILPSNLILIDEIFNSTSSDEASALSIAYFHELHKRAKCHILVSTHHQMFKTLVHENELYSSCHVGFDPQEMKPTYKIQWGNPGPSMAIDIFNMLATKEGAVSEISEHAKKLLGYKSVSYESLLQRVSQKQIELDKLIQSNQNLQNELKNQKGAMEGILKLKLNDEIKEAQKEIKKILDDAYALIEKVKHGEITKVKKIDDLRSKIARQLNDITGEEPPKMEEVIQGSLDINQIKNGDRVYSHVLNKEFTVISTDQRKNEVLLSKGTIKIKVPASTLKLAGRAKEESKVSITLSKSSSPRLEYDTRGIRLSEFQALIENALGDLLCGDIPYLNIIHGHGDGVLKNWLRGYLKKSDDFKGEIPENGNDGETKITLR